MADTVPTSAKDTASQYGFEYQGKGGWIGRSDRQEFDANVTNDIAMTLLNKDIEQEVWERDVAYNDPSAQFARLTAAGMHPLLAMQAIAGVGSSAPQLGLPSGDISPQNYGASRAARMANVNASARNIADSALQFSQARNLDVQTDLMPSQVQSQQDLQRSQAWLNNQQSSVVRELAKSEISAREMSNKLAAAESAYKDMLKRQSEAQIKLMHKEFEFFDKDKEVFYKKCHAEIKLAYEQARTEDTKRVMYNSQADLNRNSIRVGDAQIALMDNQGKLVSAQEFAQKVASVEAVIKNMHLTTGADYSTVGAGLVLDWSNKGVYDSFGRIKDTNKLLDENSEDYRIYKEFQKIDYNSYGDAHSLATQSVVSGYINSGCQVINSASGVVGSVKGTELLPAFVNKK